MFRPVNPYMSLAKHLEWDDNNLEWITLNYISFLKSKLNHYINFNGTNAIELKELISIFNTTELESFVSYPFVADLLHPRTKLHNDENIWPLNVYALSYLSWIGKLPANIALKQKPDGIRQIPNSIPLSNRVYEFPLSFETEMNFPGMDRGGNELFVFSPEQIDEIRPIINNSLSFIKKWSKNVWEFVSIGTELLIIRGESSEPNRFSSSSFRGLAGLNMLINPQNANMHLIIDAIVHESIHSLLYQLEPSFEDFFPNKDNSRNEVKSPWSGNIITLDNIAQACFVWYGLYNFWTLASSFINEDEPALESKSTINKIYLGFKNLDLIDLEKNLNTNMYYSIEYMKNKILKTTANSGLA